MASNIVLSTKEFNVVGKSPVRHDGVDKVTGKAAYGADIDLPGMLHGKVLRSPYAHARIKSINVTKAQRHPDVKAIALASDLASVSDTLTEIGEEVFTSMKYLCNNVLAESKVLYKGHAVAAVAASNPHAAEEALELIQVDYEILPSVTDVESAMDPEAPVLHENIMTAGFGGELSSGTNVAAHQQFKLGDIDKGFAEADLVLEREYRTKTVHQGYIEPQNGTAWWTSDGQLTIWCSSQGHFGIRDNTATVLGQDVSKIKVVPMEIGGGFGGKLPIYLEPLAAILSKKSGRPVKMTMSRAEVLEATGPTSGSLVKIKMGVTNQGRITAVKAYLAFEAGAYPGSPVSGAAVCMLGPYDVNNLLIDGYDVVTNKPKTSAYRAPGAPMGAFAVEALVDEICESLDMDPLEFRRLNAAKEGTRRADGTLNPRIGMVETVEAMKAHPHYSSTLVGDNRGRGVVTGFWRNNSHVSSVVVDVVQDGTVSLIEGSIDIGGTRTAVAQQLAEVLGISVEDVKPQIVDTDSIAYTSHTGGSGVAFKTGWAVYEAGQDIKVQFRERAAKLWEIGVEQVEYVDGVVQHKADPELRLTFKELAAKLNDIGGPVSSKATVNPRGVGGSYCGMIVDVEVDPETGKVDILRCTAFQDAGKAVHPSYVEGQIQGGTVQGIGWAMNEEYFMSEDGRLLNASLLDYRMPTMVDVPMIDTVIIEVANPGHPFGVRGVGEGSIVPPLAAMANAIYDAVGVRMYQLPMSPVSIVKKLGDKSIS